MWTWSFSASRALPIPAGSCRRAWCAGCGWWICRRMADEMLVAQARWLPQYADAIPAARKRLARCKRLGTKKWAGAARLHTKTVAEIRAEMKRRKK